MPAATSPLQTLTACTKGLSGLLSPMWDMVRQGLILLVADAGDNNREALNALAWYGSQADDAAPQTDQPSVVYGPVPEPGLDLCNSPQDVSLASDALPEPASADAAQQLSPVAAKAPAETAAPVSHSQHPAIAPQALPGATAAADPLAVACMSDAPAAADMQKAETAAAPADVCAIVDRLVAFVQVGGPC